MKKLAEVIKRKQAFTNLRNIELKKHQSMHEQGAKGKEVEEILQKIVAYQSGIDMLNWILSK